MCWALHKTILPMNTLYVPTTTFLTSQTLSVRSFDYNFFRPTFSGAGNYLAGGGNARSNLANVLNAEVSHVWTIRPNLVNDLRLGFDTI